MKVFYRYLKNLLSVTVLSGILFLISCDSRSDSDSSHKLQKPQTEMAINTAEVLAKLEQFEQTILLDKKTTSAALESSKLKEIEERSEMQIQELKNKLDTLTREYEESKSTAGKVQVLEKDLEGLKIEKAKLEMALNEKESVLKELKDKSADQGKRAENMARKLAEENVTLENKITLLEKEHKAAENLLIKVEKEKLSLEQNLSGLKAKSSSAEELMVSHKQLKEEKDRLSKELSELQNQYEMAQNVINKDKVKTEADIERLKSFIKLLSKENEELEHKIADTAKSKLNSESMVNDLEARNNEYKEQLNTAQLELNEFQKQLAQSQTSEKQLQAKLEKIELVTKRVASLENERIRLENELLLKQTELDGLKLSRGSLASIPKIDKVATGSVPTQSKEDVTVVEVKVDKAQLRTGPNEDKFPPKLHLAKGTRLLVETREGDWYRVFTPNGMRLWIRGDLVNTVEGGDSVGSGSTKEKGNTARVAVQKPIEKEEFVSFGEVESKLESAEAPSSDAERAYQFLKGIGSKGGN